MGKKQLFRKKSLDRLASPERLDRLVAITTPKGWVMILTLIGLIVVLLFWGIFGSIPTKLSGQALFIHTGGLQEVTAGSAGRVTSVSVELNDPVQPGQLVARLDQPQLDAELMRIELELTGLKRELDLLEVLTEQRAIAQQRHHKRLRASLLERVADLEERLEIRRELLAAGLITRRQLLETRDELAGERARLGELELTELNANFAAEQQLDEQRRQVRLKEQQREHTFRARSKEVEIHSSYRGRVIAVSVTPGKRVNPGDKILTIEPEGPDVQRLEAVLFVSANDGHRIEPGMEVMLSPAGVRREVFGQMLGRVSHVADYPTTREEVLELLQNRTVVDSILAHGSVYQVDVDLIPESNNYSGFRWTSSEGPPQRITSGLMGSATVTVERQPPIALLLPTARSSPATQDFRDGSSE